MAEENMWITDEFGTRRFKHGDWELTWFHPDGSLYVENTANRDWSVYVMDDCLCVRGAQLEDGYAVAVDIPFAVLREIILASANSAQA